MFIVGRVPPKWLIAIVSRLNERYPLCEFAEVDGDTIVAENMPGPYSQLLIEAYIHGVNDARGIYGVKNRD